MLILLDMFIYSATWQLLGANICLGSFAASQMKKPCTLLVKLTVQIEKGPKLPNIINSSSPIRKLDWHHAQHESGNNHIIFQVFLFCT
jgi:hypothetical protein